MIQIETIEFLETIRLGHHNELSLCLDFGVFQYNNARATEAVLKLVKKIVSLCTP